MTGTVPDVRPHLAAADVVVCPLAIARGIQNKVLEAMAMGKAVIASPAAIEGLEVSTGTHLLRAEGPAQYPLLIERLLAKASERTRLGLAARRLIENRYTWPRRMARLVSICERLLAPAIPPLQPNRSGKDFLSKRSEEKRETAKEFAL